MSFIYISFFFQIRKEKEHYILNGFYGNKDSLICSKLCHMIQRNTKRSVLFIIAR